ncbi:MAG: hypothetical protein QM766_20115 [Burkholderiaceae bacterium]
MPGHLVGEAIAAGHLMRIEIEDDPPLREGLTIHAAHRRDQAPGVAGRWLLEELERRLCP